MTKSEMDKLRSSTLNNDEVLKVRHIGKYGNFTTGKIYDCKPRFAHKSGLPYPQPKWIACYYQIVDDEGDSFNVSDSKYGELHYGFEWVK